MKIIIILWSLLSFIFIVSAGRWSDWQPFEPCITVQQRPNKNVKVVDLQEGTQTRTRFCLEEDHESANAEEEMPPEDCEEDTKETESRACRIPTVWSKFVAQGECSVTCGPGKRKMKRHCILNTGALPGEEKNEICQLGSEETVLQNCRKRSCPVNGGWSEWSAWGACGSAECHFPKQSDIQGQVFSIRTCSNPIPKYEGKMCDGPFLKIGTCFDPVNCPTDGIWSAWGNWSNWNCELGTRNRTRACDNPPARNGGKRCEGSVITFDDKIQNIDSFNKTCGTVLKLENPDEIPDPDSSDNDLEEEDPLEDEPED